MVHIAAATAGTTSSTTLFATVAVAVVTSSALAALFTGLLNRRKISSEAENIQAQTSELVWARVKAELERQDRTIAGLQSEMQALGVLLRDMRRKLDVAIAYIERLLDTYPRGAQAPPAIPPELMDDLPPGIVEDWRRPTTQTVTHTVSTTETLPRLEPPTEPPAEPDVVDGEVVD